MLIRFAYIGQFQLTSDEMTDALHGELHAIYFPLQETVKPAAGFQTRGQRKLDVPELMKIRH
jgi:hypothetical protein